MAAVGALAQVQRTGEGQEAKWEVLEGCHLLTNSVVDGDSFHVEHQGREYIFRLYFVDAPESDPAMKERVRDQAVYFGVNAADIPRAGQEASRFTRARLTGQEITVITRWQNALGRSRLARFYGVALVDGQNLAEMLVAQGWARIYGLRANWPDGPRSTTFINKLKNLELSAREKKLGLWNQATFPLETEAEPGPGPAGQTNPTPAGDPRKSGATTTVVDLNVATFEELKTLPGIGPKLAERIIAHRPYQTLADLDAVPGVGPALIKRLQPLIRITPSAP